MFPMNFKWINEWDKNQQMRKINSMVLFTEHWNESGSFEATETMMSFLKEKMVFVLGKFVLYILADTRQFSISNLPFIYTKERMKTKT